MAARDCTRRVRRPGRDGRAHGPLVARAGFAVTASAHRRREALERLRCRGRRRGRRSRRSSQARRTPSIIVRSRRAASRRRALRSRRAWPRAREAGCSSSTCRRFPRLPRAGLPNGSRNAASISSTRRSAAGRRARARDAHDHGRRIARGICTRRTACCERWAPRTISGPLEWAKRSSSSIRSSLRTS